VQKKYEQLTGENVMVFNEKLFRAADEGLKKGAEEGEGEEEEEEEEGNVEEDGGEGFKEESAVNNGSE
jgi:hypothetical protein